MDAFLLAAHSKKVRWPGREIEPAGMVRGRRRL